RSQAHRGLSLFVVPKPRAEGHGFDVDLASGAGSGDRAGGRMQGRAIDTIGYRGMHSYEVSFEDWRVPSACLIGGDDGLGRGFYPPMGGFENGRLQTAAGAAGVMQAPHEAAPPHARQRVDSGRPAAGPELAHVKL